MFIHKVNIQTGETADIEMTEEDLAWAAANAEETAQVKAKEIEEAEIKNAAKAEILAKLGITEEEAKILLS